jgi:ATPase subunit of ABC transporter with duplicated ATPase domains
MALQRVAVGPVPEVALLHDISFEVVGPERLALTGPNGSGKTTLLRVLAGLQAPSAGTLYRGVPVGQVALLDQHVSLLGRARTIRDAFVAHHPTLDVTDARAALAQFQFRADAALQSVDTLSGGERMRAALACVLAGPATPRCLVLDEPTNHLDLDSIEQLEAALRAYDGALIVASHDETFLANIGIERRMPVSRWQVPATT